MTSNNDKSDLRCRIRDDYDDRKNPDLNQPTTNNITQRPKTPCARKKKLTVEIKEKEVKKTQPVKVENPGPSQVNRVFICPKCDKSYKSRRGVLKHVPGCLLVNEQPIIR